MRVANSVTNIVVLYGGAASALVANDQGNLRRPTGTVILFTPTGARMSSILPSSCYCIYTYVQCVQTKIKDARYILGSESTTGYIIRS